MQPDLTQEILELVRLTATDLPEDVERKLREAREIEEKGSAAQRALDAILENVKMAREKSSPICQDTGTPLFNVTYPAGWSTLKLREQINSTVIEATRLTYLRPNAVNAVTGVNTGDNTGGDHYPSLHFKESAGDQLIVELILKGAVAKTSALSINYRMGQFRREETWTGCVKQLWTRCSRLRVKDVPREPWGLPWAEIGDLLTQPPKRLCCAAWMTKILINNWQTWRSRFPGKPTSWGLVQWGSGVRLRFWAPRLKGCTGCRPVILCLCPICAGHTAGAKWFTGMVRSITADFFLCPGNQKRCGWRYPHLFF